MSASLSSAVCVISVSLSSAAVMSASFAPPYCQVAGEEIEIEELMDEEGEDTVKHSTKELASRESFVKMGHNLKMKVGA